MEVSCRCSSGERSAELVAMARDGVAELEALSQQAGPVKLADSLGAAITTIADRSDPAKPSHLVKTGITDFDNRLGGLAPEEVIIVAARPGKGKTSYANGIARCASGTGVPTCIISIEMSMQQELERLLSLESGIPATFLRSGRDGAGEPLGLNYHKNLMAAGVNLSNLPLWIDSRPLTLGQLVSTLRRWYAKEVIGKGFPIGLVIVDYIQLVGLEQKGRETSREQQVARISRSMKWLAKQLHCPMVVLCQLNRDIEKRGGEPRLSDLRESGAIEQDADIVIFIDRDNDEEEGAANKDCNGKLIVGKNRNGPIGKFPLLWKAATMRFLSREVHQADYDGPDARGPHWADGKEPTP
jgi:replicative DNA helicase